MSSNCVQHHTNALKVLCATKYPQSALCHNPVQVWPIPLPGARCGVPHPYPPSVRHLTVPTLLCPVTQGYPSSDQHHSRRRGAVYTTPCPGRGYTRHMGSVNTARRLRGLGAILRALEASPVQRPYARPVRPLQRKWQARRGEHFVRFISFCV